MHCKGSVNKFIMVICGCRVGSNSLHQLVVMGLEIPSVRWLCTYLLVLHLI